MNNFQIISKADLENLNISQAIQADILKGISNELNFLQNLQIINSNLLALMEKVMIKQETDNSRKGNRQYSYSYKKMRKQSFKQVSLAGALFIFKVRQYLTQEDIIFSLGVTDSKGQLFERQITQTDLFQKANPNIQRLNLRSSLSQKAILLSKTLETFNAEQFTEIGQINLWPQILALAFEGKGVKNQGNDIVLGDNIYYQKDSPDIDVYIRYTEGRKKAKKNYYYGKELKFFNQGWLYEWYTSYIQNGDLASFETQLAKEEYLADSIINKQSLAPIMQKMDQVPGYAGGDYIDKYGQQIQAKYGNQKIISYVSILTVLQEIDKILLNLQNINISNVSKEFVSLFTNDSGAINRLNKNYNEIVEQQLLKGLGLT